MSGCSEQTNSSRWKSRYSLSADFQAAALLLSGDRGCTAALKARRCKSEGGERRGKTLKQIPQQHRQTLARP